MSEAPASKVASLLLAAGGSSRLGRSKQLLEFRGQTLLRRSAELLALLTPAVNVVTGAKRAQVELELEDLALTLVHNERWREGIGLSIGLGVEKLPPGARAVLVMLCDQYRVGQEQLEILLEAWRSEPDRIIVARWSGGFGPPVVFPRRLFLALTRLSGDRGARQLLVENRSRIRYVNTPEAAYDVDDPGDLALMRQYETGPSEA